MSLTLSELNIKSKQKICCFKSSLKQSPFTSASSSKTCISFSDSRSNYQNNRFTHAVRNCAYCICTENICYPICSTISLAFVMMLAPVQHTIPAISMLYQRALYKTIFSSAELGNSPYPYSQTKAQRKTFNQSWDFYKIKLISAHLLY